MPTATAGAIKHVSAPELDRLDAPIILANTYHLMLRPGAKLIKRLSGLHEFLNWRKPILTDSGGFQVFSLGGKKRGGVNLVKLTEKGVRFRSHLDGALVDLSPEKALRIQADLGVDIAVCLDECVALPASRRYLERSVALTTAWAAASKAAWRKLRGRKPLLFCVVQGGLDKKLREWSLDGLLEIGFDGYNIGGLSVGETPAEMYRVLDWLTPRMPEDKPRYLMGVGYPEQIIEAVKRGIDMFDCVIPTREGRHGRLFLRKKSSKLQVISSKTFYHTINIANSRFKADRQPINPDSRLPELREYSRAYLNHLFKISEPLGARLATLNNLEFYLDLMAMIRSKIKAGRL